MSEKSASAISLLLAWLTVGLLASAVHAAEKSCGILQGRGREIDESPRFELFGAGGAFVDLRTCLVWRLDPIDDLMTLSDGMQTCASLGQGGPHGDMGWQLPTMAELTSLDGEEWSRQSEEFDHLPSFARAETDFWTSSPWLGRPNSWAVVQFSARTTIVRPVGSDEKAGVWCVRGVPARGLRTP
jgi:hypothetical protein